MPQRLRQFVLARPELDRFVDRELQHVGNRLVLETHFEHVGLETFPAAGVAGHEHIGHEHHLHLNRPGAFARFAATAFHIEGEVSGTVSSRARQRRFAEQPTNLVIGLHVRHGIRSRGLANG